MTTEALAVYGPLSGGSFPSGARRHLEKSASAPDLPQSAGSAFASREPNTTICGEVSL